MKIVRLLSFLLAFLFVFSAAQEAYAFSDHCPRHDMKTFMKKRKYKTRVFRGTIAGFNEYLHGHANGDGRGVTLAFVDPSDLTASFEYKYDVVQLGPDKFCVRMTHVRGIYEMRPRLYMPTDYKKESCQYKEILKHEKRHLAALDRFHEKYAPKFESHLGRIARELPVPNPVPRSQIQLVQGQLAQFFIDEFAGFFHESLRLLDIEQSKIDSEQEYRTFQNRCDSW